MGADGAERAFRTAFKHVTKHAYATVAKSITALSEGMAMANPEEKADGTIKATDLFPCMAWNPAPDQAAGMAPAEPEDNFLTWGALLAGVGACSAAFLERATTINRYKVAKSAAISMVLEAATKEDRANNSSLPIEKMWAVITTLADIVSGPNAYRVHGP